MKKGCPFLQRFCTKKINGKFVNSATPMSGKRRKLAAKEHDVPPARDLHPPSAIASLLASRETLGNKYGCDSRERWLERTSF